ncbi:MAG: S16 family serine protease [Actinomycetota bacterium]|nr:S16 family serine protease [Actinomycetota bacterium]
MDTPDDTLSPTFGHGSGSRDRASGYTPLRVAVALVIIGAVLALTFIRLPYVAFRPGSVTALSARVDVTKGEHFDPTGEIYFTTVRQDSSVNGWEFIHGSFDDSVLLIDEDAVLGDRDPDENQEFNMELMRVSKSTAVAVALRHLGLNPYQATGVGMSSVSGPAEGLLTTNDVITAMDGAAVSDVDDLIAEIRLHAPGDSILLEVEDIAGRSRRKVEVELGSRDDDPLVAFLGIAPQTRLEDVEDLPVNVRVNTGQVGGNSAGLALSLAVIDVLTPGELTGGIRVATTGTISLDGSVGPIGGIVQKVVAARDAGIDLFLVPEAEEDAARSQAGDIQIEGVSDLDDALRVLTEIGGNGDSLVPLGLGDAES